MRRIVLAVASLAIVAGGCRQSPTVDDLAAVEDALEPPQAWQQVDEDRVGRCADLVKSCPRIVTTYDAPSDVDFVDSTTTMLESAGLTVITGALDTCGYAGPFPGCSVRARAGEVAVRATMTDMSTGGYTVSVRVTEYLGP